MEFTAGALISHGNALPFQKLYIQRTAGRVKHSLFASLQPQTNRTADGINLYFGCLQSFRFYGAGGTLQLYLFLCFQAVQSDAAAEFP